jgi:hypothetical protein
VLIFNCKSNERLGVLSEVFSILFLSPNVTCFLNHNYFKI